ncbi:MAG: creatininase family protein [Deltaproteobacteria bacterium]|nr:creatininase family protein [Deltaproteobacteria bacterium]
MTTAGSEGERARLRRWQDMTGPQIAELDPAKTIVLVTCSPLEVHGPHLPTSADMTESEGLLEATATKILARRDDLTFVMLPPVYAASDVLAHRGSLKFSPNVVTTILEELGATLARQGFRHVWVGNFHAGPRHILAIERACDRVNRRHDARMVSVFSLLVKRITGGSSDASAFLAGVGGISKQDLHGDSHGGVVETSMLLHLVGRHVDPRYADLPPRSLELDLERAGRAPLQKADKPTVLEIIRSLPLRARYYDRETYAGIPARASAELGREYLDRFSSEAATALLELWDGKIGLEEQYSPMWPFRRVMLSELVYRAFDKLVGLKPSPI